MSANIAATCRLRSRPTWARPSQNVGVASPSPSGLRSACAYDSYRAQDRTARNHSSDTTAIGPQRGQRQPPPGRLEEAGEQPVQPRPLLDAGAARGGALPGHQVERRCRPRPA